MLKNIFEFNRVILTMVVVDFFMNGAFSAIAPFFAIFISQEIAGGSATVVGVATAIYWGVKSVIQIPIARWLDKTDGERDEFWALFFGYLLSAAVPVIFFFATEVWHIYAAQALFGVLFAFAVPAWYSIFTRHLDKFRIGFEWSLQSVIAVGASTALASGAAGFLVDRFGFRVVFLIASALIVVSSFGLLTIRKKIFPAHKTLEKVWPENKNHKFHH